MRITLNLSTESQEIAARIAEFTGCSISLVISRMVNSQLESLNVLRENHGPGTGSERGPVSLNIPPGNPHQPRQEVSSPLLEPGEDFVKPYEKPIRERLTKEEFLEEYKPIEGC